MKKIIIATMLVAATALAKESSTGPREGAIKAVFAQVDTCVAKTDAKCLTDLYTDDATLLISSGGSKLVIGRAAIAKVYESLFEMFFKPAIAANPKLKMIHTVQNVRLIDGDRAVVDCSVEITGIKPAESGASSAPATRHETALMVLKNGKWFFEDLRSYVFAGEKTPAAVTPAKPPAT